MKLQRQTAVVLGVLCVGVTFGCNGQGGGSSSGRLPLKTTTAPVSSGTISPPATASVSTSSVAAKPASRFAYALDLNDKVDMFTIDAKTGVPAAGTQTPLTAGTGGFAITSSHDGKYLYVLLATDIASFSVDPKTGALTQIAGQTITLNSAAFTWNIAVDPTNAFVVITDQSDDSLTSFKIGANGALTNAGKAMAATGSAVEDIAFDPTGKFVYVTGNTLGNVTCFTMDAQGNLAMASSVMTSGTGTRPVAIDPAGAIVYVGNETDMTVSAFTRNTATGALTAVGKPLTASGPVKSLAIDSLGKNLYVGCDTNTAVANSQAALNMFKIDGKGGVTVGAPASTPCGGFPLGLSIDNSGTFAFDANYGDSTISAFKIDPVTGVASTNGNAVAVPNAGVVHGLTLVK
jgi:6-phosphogluconolactonase (cycloisomerase 2 family)